MAIALAEYVHTAKVVKSGNAGAIPLVAGQKLRVETSPDGEEILDVECPAGKAWTARIIVEITETDA